MTARQSFSFRKEPQAVRSARRALERLGAKLPSARLHDASLCLSELVTNAIQHARGGSELELSMALDERRLRVEVADGGGGFEPGEATPGSERGWGLFIVDNLADGWGVEPGNRTVVWFEIAR